VIDKQIAITKLSLMIMLIFSCCLSGCASVNSKQQKDSWFGPDKAKHFVVSAAIGAGSSTILKNKGRSDCDAAAGGLSISLAFGAGKEYHDKYISNKYWSWKDMFWNLVGGTVGSLAATGCY
jgi:putative lipoprotein